MKVLLEVFRNTPPGKNCQLLSRNVLEVAAANVEKDLEVRFLPLSSPEADERGVEIAPALAINRRRVVEGVPSAEEIGKLVAEVPPLKLGVVLTKSPHGGEAAENALELCCQALEAGDGVGLFLLSDGVWAARRGQEGSVGSKLERFLRGGGEVFVSGEHLEAGGLGEQKLLEGVTIAPDPFDRLVDLVMEDWDKVVVF